MFKKSLALALGLMLAGAAQAADTYSFDGAHTEISFRISHWVINKVRGFFRDFSGNIKYDSKKAEKSSVEVSIQAGSIDTGNGMRDKHLKSPDFFETEKFPSLAFKSTKVAAGKEEGSLEISGDLTLHGVTKPVVLAAKITGAMEDNFGNSRIGFEATGKINRKDFGVAWNKTNKTGTAMLGDEVEIEISGEAIKKK